MRRRRAGVVPRDARGGRSCYKWRVALLRPTRQMRRGVRRGRAPPGRSPQPDASTPQGVGAMPPTYTALPTGGRRCVLPEHATVGCAVTGPSGAAQNADPRVRAPGPRAGAVAGAPGVGAAVGDVVSRRLGSGRRTFSYHDGAPRRRGDAGCAPAPFFSGWTRLPDAPRPRPAPTCGPPCQRRDEASPRPAESDGRQKRRGRRPGTGRVRRALTKPSR